MPDHHQLLGAGYADVAVHIGGKDRPHRVRVGLAVFSLLDTVNGRTDIESSDAV